MVGGGTRQEPQPVRAGGRRESARAEAGLPAGRPLGKEPGQWSPLRFPVWLSVLLLSVGGDRALAQGNRPAASPDAGAVRGGAEPGGQAPSGYRLGPEDVIEVSVWKQEALTQEETIRPDGRISLKLIGDIPAGGMTLALLRQYLAERYREFIPDAEVSVTLRAMNSFKVYVMGRVSKPGELTVRSRLTVLQALALAGGFTPYANARDIKVFRAQADQDTILEFNYRDVTRGRGGDIELRPGDRIIVP